VSVLAVTGGFVRSVRMLGECISGDCRVCKECEDVG